MVHFWSLCVRTFDVQKRNGELLSAVMLHSSHDRAKLTDKKRQSKESGARLRQGVLDLSRELERNMTDA